MTASAAEAALEVPETVSVAVKPWLPSASFAVVAVKAPVLSAVAVPTCVVPSNTLTVLFATAVPLNGSVVSLVMWSPATPLSVENLAIVGAVGAVGADGTVTASAADAKPVLPAASIAFVVKLWPPLARGAVVRLHAPAPLAVAVPTEVAPSNTCKVLLASAVPVNCTLVVPLTIEAPVSIGALGATVSIVTASAAEAVLVKPETVSVAVKP